MKSTLLSRSFLALVFTCSASMPRAEEHTDQAKPMTIERLVSTTLASNPELKFYEAEIARAKADHRASGAPENPQLSFDVGRMRVAGDSASKSAASAGLAYAVTLAQPIEWPGRLALRKAIAGQDVKLAELGVAQFRSYLVARIRSLALTLCLQQANANATDEVSRRFTAVRDVLVQRDPSGAAPQLESRIIEAAEMSIQRRSIEAAVQAQKTLLEINQLIGLRADTPLIVQRTDFSVAEPPDLNALLTVAATQNFDVRVRRTELEQQGLRVELAKNERRPTFTVGPTINDQMPGGRETTVGISVSVPLPFWRSGREVVDVAEAKRIQAEATLNSLMRETERKVAEAFLVLSVQHQRLTSWNPDSLDRFREAASDADEHYRLGAVTVSSYLEMQDRYLQALDAIHSTQLDVLQSALDLEQLVGLDKPLVTLRSVATSNKAQ